MENIKIIDNFLSKEELNEIVKYINSSEFTHNISSGSDEKFDNKHFVIKSFEKCYIENIKKKIEKYSSKKLEIFRSWMATQLYGQFGAYHTDNDDTDVPYYSLCIYITDISDEDIENANGDFLIKIPNTKSIMCINALMNRGVFFPSNYIHKGMAYNRLYNNRRFCITLQLREVFEK